MGIKTETYIRKPLYVEAVKVTEENFDEIRAWVSGKIEKDGPKRFIRVFVKDPKVPRQSKAYVGDWILWTERGGHKVYTPKAFEAAFDRVNPPVVEMAPGVTIEAARTSVTTLPPVESPEMIQARETIEAEGGTVEPATAKAIADVVNEQQPKVQVDDGVAIKDAPTAPPAPPEGKTVLSLDQQRHMTSDEIMEALRSGDVVLEQDLAA